MFDNAEEGIAKTQAVAAQVKGSDGLKEHHKWNISYLNERIIVFVFTLCFICLIILWMVVESEIVLYGSLFGVMLLSILWGVVKLKRIEKTRVERQNKADSWKSIQKD